MSSLTQERSHKLQLRNVQEADIDASFAMRAGAYLASLPANEAVASRKVFSSKAGILILPQLGKPHEIS
jgi:hypothetical protein